MTTLGDRPPSRVSESLSNSASAPTAITSECEARSLPGALRALGVDQNAELIYKAALEQSSWARVDLIDHAIASTRLPQQLVGERVDGLVRLGLLRSSVGDDARDRLRVVAPNVALSARLQDAHRRASEAQHAVMLMTSALDELTEDYARARSEAAVLAIEHLAGLDAVQSTLEQLAARARSEVLSFMPGGSQSARSMQASRPLDEAALRRGVLLRSVYLHSARNDADTLAYIRDMERLGGHNRTAASLPLRMLIVDREVAVVPIEPTRTRDGALVVRSPGILTALLSLFESVWFDARPVTAPRRQDTSRLSDTDHEVLRLLATGATDDMVARALAISVRTVRRVTAGVLAKYDAQSRFELGLRLGREGWEGEELRSLSQRSA